MKRVCAWCNKGMEEDDGSDSLHDGVVTHGICADCADNIEFQLGVSLKKFLNSFRVPIVLVNGDSSALSANRSALDLMGKELAAIDQMLLGNVFECAYSRLPGGCGKTVHCCGCTIRNAVSHTYSTGIPSVRLPARIEYNGSGAENGTTFLVSTEKMLNFVLLTVETLAMAGAMAGS